MRNVKSMLTDVGAFPKIREKITANMSYNNTTARPTSSATNNTDKPVGDRFARFYLYATSIFSCF